MERYQYLLLMAGCLAVTLPLEFLLHARVYRRPMLLLRALPPVVLVFVGWDLLGIHRDHWSYNPAYVTGVDLPGRMPVEELVFFLVIPVCGLLTYEAVGDVLLRLRRRRGRTSEPGPVHSLWSLFLTFRFGRVPRKLGPQPALQVRQSSSTSPASQGGGRDA